MLHGDWAFNSPKKFFVRVAIGFGMVLIFLIPPGHVPDEPNHFYKAYAISKGDFGGQVQDRRLGGVVPKSIVQFFKPFNKLRYHYEERITFSDYLKVAKIPLNTKIEAFQDFPNTAIYTPIGYVPQVITILLLRSLHLPPIVIFYLTRLIGFLFWVFIVGVAIDRIPFGKWLMAFLALLPASLAINVGITADSMTNGVSFLLIAQILYLATMEKDLKLMQLAGIIGLSGVLAITKIVYTPLFLLVILIPAKKFSPWRKEQTAKLTFLASGLLSILFLVIFLFHHSKDLYISYKDYNPEFREGQQVNEGADPPAQLNFILDKPTVFVKSMLRSYAGSAKASIAHYFGKYGWEKNYLPAWLIGLLGFSVLGVALSEKHILFGWKERLLLVAIGLSMMVAFTVVIYLQWSPVGAERVYNLGGRYMIPIFPLFFLVLPALFKQQKKWIGVAQVVLMVSLIGTIYLIFARYFNL